MKPTFLQVGEEEIFPELVQNPAYGLNVRLARVFGVDHDVIQIYDNEDIELLREDLIEP